MKGKIKFTGNFGAYFAGSLVIMIVGIVGVVVLVAAGTAMGGVGLAMLFGVVSVVVLGSYIGYWLLKYFFENLEIEIDDARERVGRKRQTPTFEEIAEKAGHGPPTTQ